YNGPLPSWAILSLIEDTFGSAGAGRDGGSRYKHTAPLGQARGCLADQVSERLSVTQGGRAGGNVQPSIVASRDGGRRSREKCQILRTGGSCAGCLKQAGVS